MNWLEQSLGKEWNITPAGGLTGDAYVASKAGKRLFLKRNSSPFLAVLSAEGIVPKLVWTKRLENGDVITAQQWLEGRELSPEEMRHLRVASLLRKIHNSSELLHMLMRLGKKAVNSDQRLNMLVKQLKLTGLYDNYKEVRAAIGYLEELLPITRDQPQVVCHCDLNHNNILLTEQGQLYLIDWDNAMIADPAMDFGLVLKWYVPPEDWDEWLNVYGAENNKELIVRIYWYLIMDTLFYLAWHTERSETMKRNSRLYDLKELNQYVASAILHSFAE